MGKNIESENKKSTILTYLKDERVLLIFGVFIIVLSSYLGVAFLSFLFTGGNDQSIVEHLDLSTSEEIKCEVQNWTGYRGARIANFFMAHSFGLSCFLPIYFFMLAGLKLLTIVKDVNLKRLFIFTFFGLLWISFVLSFLGAETSYFNLGGYCGLCEVNWMEAQIGQVGTFFFIVFSALIFSMFMYDGTVKFVKGEYNLMDKIKESRLSRLFSKPISSTKPITDENVNEDDGKREENTNIEIENNSEQGDSHGQEDLKTNDVVLAESYDVIADTQKDTVEENASENDDDESENVSMVINVPSGDTDEEVDENDDLEKTSNPVELNVASVTEDSKPVDYDPLLTMGPYDPTLELSGYKMPDASLLKDYGPSNTYVDQDDLLAKKEKIESALKDYGIEIKSIEATVGPTITLYEIVPAPGVKVSKIKGLENDIAMSLSALGIRIIAPVPGKGTVGIEVPNKDPQIVSMRSVICSKSFQDCNFELPVVFGKTITNNVFTIDLAKTPHLLVAGATGQGKSVGLNALITSLLYKKHPSQLKLVMIDPKQVEFSIYSRIEKQYLAKLPGLKDSIITNSQDVIATLTSLTTEMENRYALLKDASVRNIIEYNDKFINRRLSPAEEIESNLYHHYLPYIVVIIDEYGDLIMTAGKEIEVPIARIAQKARAVGIHMVIATQRPQVKIITGLIKANFPARLAFRVASYQDSKTILEASGAQSLVGRGDMLFSSGSINMTRVQCAFMDTPEVESLTKFIGNQQGYPEAFRLPECVSESGEVFGAPTVDMKSLDPRLKEAAELVVNSGNGSTSSIQRTMRIGFNRAGSLMDQLEAIGIVGPQVGSKPRDVLVQDLIELEDIFRNLNV